MARRRPWVLVTGAAEFDQGEEWATEPKIVEPSLAGWSLNRYLARLRCNLHHAGSSWGAACPAD